MNQIKTIIFLDQQQIRTGQKVPSTKPQASPLLNFEYPNSQCLNLPLKK